MVDQPSRYLLLNPVESALPLFATMKFKFVILLFLLLSLAAPLFAQQTAPPQGLVPDCGSGAFGTKACQWEDLINTVQKVLQFITTTLAFSVASLIVLIGAFMYMFGGANPDVGNRGKAYMRDALMGYCLVVLSGILFDLVLEFIKPRLFPTQ